MSGAILFDLDGTLIDSVPTIVKCYIKVGNKMGVKVDAKLAHKIIGGSAEITISRLFKREDIIEFIYKIGYIYIEFELCVLEVSIEFIDRIMPAEWGHIWPVDSF